MDFESWLKAKGFEDPSALSESQRVGLLASWKAEVAGENNKKVHSFEELVEAKRVEEDHQRRVEARLGTAMETGRISSEAAEHLRKEAIAAKWDENRLELELLREERPKGPGIVGREPVAPGDVLEAAICLHARLEGIEKHFSERTLQAAHSRWRNGLSLGELFLTCARQGGYRGLSIKGGDLRTVLRAAFSGGIQAAGPWGPSTYDLSGILSNVANKFLRVAFEAVESTWRTITAVRSVNDFKTITSYSLTGDLQYELVPPGGEIKHGTVGSVSYTNKADTYGKLLGIDRRDIINDDLGALSSVGRRLGRGGALKINDVFWTAFLNNSAFFAAGNTNVLTGTTAGTTNSVLGLEGLQNADRVFRLQTDPDGKPLGILPAILLVPAALRVTALNIMNGLTVVATNTAQAGVLVPNSNVFAGAFRVESSVYMSNSSYTGNSATAWYLLASPADMPVIETVFLNGQEMPTVEQADPDINMLGVAFRGYHDFGVSKQEYRGGVRAAGA